MDKLHVFVLEGDGYYRIGVSNFHPNELTGQELDENSFFIDEDYQHNTKITDPVRADITKNIVCNLLFKATHNVMNIPFKG